MNQITIFDLIEENEPFTCDTCRYNEKGCCSYNEPLGRYCVMGNAYEKAAPVFPDSDFSEIVEYINEELGIEFKKADGLEKVSEDDPEPDNYYEYKKKGLRLELGKGKFFPEIYGGAYYISVGWDKTNEGGSSPVDTIEEAINYFRLVLNKHR